MKSPAALLMDYRLSAYWLITHTLGLTDCTAGTVDKRVPLDVHVLGAEVELNFLPLRAVDRLIKLLNSVHHQFQGVGATALL